MQVDEIADELYAAAPEEFVSRRDAAARVAKAEHDKESASAITALRKPTVSAWLVNLLVRDDPGLADQIRTLGEGLRAAQASLDGVALRDLTRQRRTVVAALAGRARALGRATGRQIGDAVLQEVEATLTAALADATVAEEVTSGRLTGPREFVGFGSASGGAPSAPPARPAKARPSAAEQPAATTEAPPDELAPRREAAAERRRREAVEARRKAAAKALDAARRARDDARSADETAAARVTDARTAAAEATATADAATSAVEELTTAIAELQRRHVQALKDAAHAEVVRARASARLDGAEKAATTAHERLRGAESALAAAQAEADAAASDE